MPKASRQRSTRAARDAANRGAISESQLKVKPAEVLKSVEILKSADSSSSDKIWACVGLSNLLVEADAGLRRSLGAQKIVNILCARCDRASEPDIQVNIEATGTLRNLAVGGGTETVKEIFNKTVLPVLLSHFSLLLSTLRPDDHQSTLTEEERNHARPVAWDWADNLVILIWSLAESAPKALPLLSADNVVANFLFSLLSMSLDSSMQAPISNSLATLHALSVLTDSNPAFSIPLLTADLSPLLELIKSTPTSPNKASRKDVQRHLLGVLAVSTLLNICSCAFTPLPKIVHATKESAELVKKHRKAKVLAKSIKEDLDQSSLKILLNALTVAKERVHANEETGLEDRLQDLQVTLEVLAEICNSLDGLAIAEEQEEQWDGIDSDQEQEEDGADESSIPDFADIDMEEINATVHAGTNGDVEMDAEDEGNDDGPVDIQQSARNLILSHDLVGSLLQIATPAKEAASSQNLLATDNQEGVLDLISLAQSLTRLRALEVLNNLLVTVARTSAASSFLPVEQRQATWNQLFALAHGLDSQTSLDNNRLLSIKAAIGSVWSLARSHLPVDKLASIAVGKDEVAFLLGLLQSTSTQTSNSPDAEDVCVRCIGVLGVLASRAEVTLDENAAISTALVAPFTNIQAESTASRPLLVQALDSLFDIFADETRVYDQPSFVGHNYLDVLARLIPIWQKMTKAVDRRKLPELRGRMDGTVINLKAFVQYRQALVQ